ncbi:MAG: DUF3662 domain-containing protein [Chloroflexi bacterium]|nr:DUF3662 domain-containing protein [Chloroflexota bacterium]MCC6893570.1 DUF3662 domain-containing protein [Anaerolineae bacterium]
MKDQHVARLEAQLERLVENTFAHLFGKRVKAQDIALQLARALEDFAVSDSLGDGRRIAPDQYTISMTSAMRHQLLQHQPDLPQILGNYLVELATNAGYRLNLHPQVDIIANDSLVIGAVSVIATHRNRKNSTTAIMQRVELDEGQDVPHNPQLLIQGKPAIALSTDIVNIGRSRDNHIVIDDRAVSRYHLQLRLRFGRYTLFDTQSQGGTMVNNVRVKEHNLQTGDVIQIGNTQLVYMEDRLNSDGQTQTIDDVMPD